MALHILYVLLAFIALMALGVILFVRKKLKSHSGFSPDTYPKSRSRKRIVCIGDSITRGSRSFDYISYLSKLPQFADYDFINAGGNRDLAWNVLERLDSIIELQPDYITILIGSYEVDATLSKKNEKRYMKSNNLPQIPSMEWFEENIRQIVQRLQSKTSARLALISPPLVGDDLDEESNHWSAQYSAILKKVADQCSVDYLALNERERELIQSLGYRSKISYKKGSRLYRKAAFKHYVLGKSWDEIANKNGFMLTPDLFHKNSKGGKIIVHLIDKFITRSEGDQLNSRGERSNTATR